MDASLTGSTRYQAGHGSVFKFQLSITAVEEDIDVARPGMSNLTVGEENRRPAADHNERSVERCQDANGFPKQAVHGSVDVFVVVAELSHQQLPVAAVRYQSRLSRNLSSRSACHRIRCSAAS
jgi:hypothetical protein